VIPATARVERSTAQRDACETRFMHCSRSLDSTGVLLRTAALAVGMASAWACGSPNEGGECTQGSDGCPCALGFCDDGLTCVADVCMPADPSSDTTAAATTEDDPSTSTAPGDTSSTDTGVADSSSSTGEVPTDPIFEATVDGVPSSFDIDPHAYLSPGGTLLAVGSESGGQNAELLLRIPPTGPGMHACVLDDIGVAIYWTIQGPKGQLELSTRTSGMCTITVDEYGEVGEFVSGTFSGELRYPGAGGLPPIVITDGVFHVLRTPDE
jgi:hypothetical protein